MNRRQFLSSAALLAATPFWGNAVFAQNKTRALEDFFVLPKEVKIPKIGLGLWRVGNSEVGVAVEAALKTGYRHFDSAQAYGNEKTLGEAIQLAIQNKMVKREDVFITSKVRAEHKTYEAAKESIEESLQKINLDYIDLMLIHAPQPWYTFRKGNYDKENQEVWRAMEEFYANGKIKAIGVSNFLEKDLENIFQSAQVRPSVNQILLHIGKTPFGLVDFCKKENVLVEAYSPIAHGSLLRDPNLEKLAQKYQVSTAQLCIRYTLQLDVVTLPKSSKPQHIAQNAEVDFEISAEDMEILKNWGSPDYGENAKFPVFKK